MAALYHYHKIAVQDCYLHKKQHFSPLFANICKTDVLAIFNVHLVLAVHNVCCAPEGFLINYFFSHLFGGMALDISMQPDRHRDKKQGIRLMWTRRGRTIVTHLVWTAGTIPQ